MKLWAGRFQKETDTLVNDFNSSIQFDARLYKQDIAGSIAHAQMLGKQGIIEGHEVEEIVTGLKAILEDIEADKVEFSVDNEDIHMNIETLLTQRIHRPVPERPGGGGHPAVCEAGDSRHHRPDPKPGAGAGGAGQ